MKLTTISLLAIAILLAEVAYAETYYHAHIASKEALQNTLEANSSTSESLEEPRFLEQHSLNESQNLYELVREFDLPNKQKPPPPQETYSQHSNRHMKNSMVIAEAAPPSINPIIIVDPADQELLDAANTLLDAENFNAAIAKYQELIARHPNDIKYLVELGRLYVRLERRKEAIEIYQQALSIDSKNIEALTALGFAYLFDGNYQDSQKTLETVLQILPTSADAFAGLGYIQAQKENLNEAEQFYDKALSFDPQNYTALIYLANLRITQQRYYEAKKIFVDLDCRYPNDPDIENGLLTTLKLIYASPLVPSDLSDQELFDEATRLIDLELFADAAEMYEELISRHPDDEDYLLALGRIYVRLNRHEEAIALYQRALKLDPENQEILKALAFAYLFSRDLENSQQTFEKILSQSPDDADVLAGLGYIAVLQENFDDAEKLFQKALSIDPENVTTLIYVGNLRLRQQRFAEAKTIFNKLLCLEPDNPDVEQGLLSTLQAMKLGKEPTPEEEEQAQEQAEPAIRASPLTKIKKLNSSPAEKTQKIAQQEANSDILDQTRNAAQLVAEKKYNEAVVEYEKIVSSQSQNANAMLELGQLYLTLERKTEGLEFLKRAFILQPDNDDIRLWLAIAYLFNNALTESQELFQILLDNDPDNPEALAGMGKIAALRKNLPLAEKKYLQVLQIDPENVSALQYLAELHLLQKRYEEAYAIYRVIERLEPDNPNLIEGLKDSREKPILDYAKRLTSEKHYQEAIQAYNQLISHSPENVEYLFYLAQLYRTMNDTNEAISVYKRALQIEPDRQDILTALAFSYLAIRDFSTSYTIFKAVLDTEPENPEALAGIGRLSALNNNQGLAEQYYQKALQISPNDSTTLEFLALLRMEQKRYEQAQPLYLWLVSHYPDNGDYAEGLRLALDQPLIDRARELEKDKNYTGAESLYQQLIANSPQHSAYYLMLGRTYISMEFLDLGIYTYSQGLEIDPDDIDLLRAMAFAYLYKALEIDAIEGMLDWSCCFPFVKLNDKENLATSEELFLQVLMKDSQDPDSIAGLGRVWALRGCLYAAEEQYLEALAVEPENITAMVYLAGLWYSEGKVFTARDTYRYLIELEPDDSDLQDSLRLAHYATEPTLTLRGFYDQENEKDLIAPDTKEWTARLHDYFGEVALTYPINDCLRLSAGAIDEFIILNDLLNDTDIYSLNIQRGLVGFAWNYCPYVTIFGSLGASYFKQYRCSTYHSNSGWYIAPNFGITINKNYHTLTLETVADSPIIARNFATNQATLVARQFARGFYEYDFGKRRAIGITGSYVWYYNSIKNDQAQFGSVWLQLTPPCYWENILLRYQFDYGRFNDLIDNYYTFQDQTTHWLKLELTKSWCADKIVATAGYGHAWQRSFEQGQIILINPIIPFRFVHREIDAAFARLNVALSNCLNVSVAGTYSHDTFDYTTASVTGALEWKF